MDIISLAYALSAVAKISGTIKRYENQLLNDVHSGNRPSIVTSRKLTHMKIALARYELVIVYMSHSMHDYKPEIMSALSEAEKEIDATLALEKG